MLFTIATLLVPGLLCSLAYSEIAWGFFKAFSQLDVGLPVGMVTVAMPSRWLLPSSSGMVAWRERF